MLYFSFSLRQTFSHKNGSHDGVETGPEAKVLSERNSPVFSEAEPKLSEPAASCLPSSQNPEDAQTSHSTDPKSPDEVLPGSMVNQTPSGLCNDDSVMLQPSPGSHLIAFPSLY